ncbi:mechanosensitive ion channel family protein [Flavihumibacter solisilvae]|uniref:mechanosensitive ion channel family protein n=1 Tax=Flavihumibacter solisilvae TaxID=1349421 RepID=UPI0009079720|nr:mechanosensitive ion channel domain-containing protein [Flavihumibacter solisilvae]
MMDSTLFAESNKPTPGDYLLSLERSFQYFNKVPVITGSFSSLDGIGNKLREDDSVLNIIKSRLVSQDRNLNIRNLQMFGALLEHLVEDEGRYEERLNSYDARMDSLRRDFSNLRKDTILRSMFRDSVLRAKFRPAIRELRTKRQLADSLFTLTNERINSLKAHVTANRINAEELENQVENFLRSAGSRAFGKERRYIWEPRTGTSRSRRTGEFRRGLQQENYIANYYFSNMRGEQMVLLVIGLAFFAWVAYNFRSLKQLGKMDALNDLQFRFLSPLPLLVSLVFVLNLAPLFDLNAPALYLETVGFLLMAVLSVFFLKQKHRIFFVYWCVFILIFLSYSFSRFLGLPYAMIRYWNLGVNSASIVLAILVLRHFRTFFKENRLIRGAILLYALLHLLAVVSNIFGRVTLSQLFSSTAIYTFTQALGLAIFVPSVREAMMLQIQASRIRNQYPVTFDYLPIQKNIDRVVFWLAVIIWLVSFTTNMNMYTSISDGISGFLTSPRNIGSFTFTIRGVLLFLFIIWLAHFLQKYIAYFWGDTGDDAAFDNKGHRSKLLITRLILLTGGFLLAVAASGLPVDKITVILGALGVGVGLGLQGIVNNFVSGIILIFDRPLRIGDMVEIGNRKGRVKEIGVRSSTILTADGAEVIIPNGDLLSENIVNWTLSNNHVRIEQVYKVDGDINEDSLRRTLKSEILAVPNMLHSREPQIILEPVGDEKYEMRIYAWCADVNKLETTQTQLRKVIRDFLAQQKS